MRNVIVQTLNFKNLGRLTSLFCFFVLMQVSTNAQVAVTVDVPANTTPALAASYTSLAGAMTALSAITAISGPIVLTAAAGTETAPAGGYVINFIAATTATNNVTVIGTTTTTITANGTLVAGNLNDAIFKIIGSDFVTIRNFTMQENPANTTTAAATNNMTEWGVALLYATTTNGAQNCVIRNNNITLNRTYQNTFGIYSNSTHTATVVTTNAPATGAAGGNSGMVVWTNNISNVNLGIVVVGPTAAADANIGIDVGGSSAGTGNTLTNYGTTSTFSGYANVSGTVNGILVRNSNGFNVSFNSITSSAGGVTAGTLNGIQIPAASATPTGTFTNNINSNTISLQSGLAAGAMNGITYPSGSASATSVLNVNSNNFTQINHSVAASGTIIAITVASTNLTTSISSNTFTNLTTNTTGSFTFISHNFSIPVAGGSCVINGNSIVTAFNKTGAGGTVTLTTTNSLSGTGSVNNYTNNTFSNITVTGATAITGFNNTDGGTGSTKTVTGNTLSSWTGGTSTINCMNFTYWNGVSSLSTNTITNITGQGAITGITLGSLANNATSIAVFSNIINNLTSTGTGGAVTGITCSNTSPIININSNSINSLSSTGAFAVIGITASGAAPTENIFKNTICDISGSNASSTVNGILVSAGTTINVHNNRIGDLRTPSANAANPLIGLNITGGTTVNCYYNTVNLAASSGGALFGSSAISASTTPTLTLNNNILVNTSTTTGAGLAVAYRRSSATLTTYAATSDRNDFVASTIYTDGVTPQVTIVAYKTLVSTRDVNSLSVTAPYLSTSCGNANFLKINTATATQLESGGANITGITDDFENTIRFGNPGYLVQVNGGGTAPDIGADEFDGTPAKVCSGTPATSTITGVAAVCSGSGTTLSLSMTYTDLQITYQWRSGTAPGGPYSTTLGTSATQATGNLTVDTYYICEVTCGNGGPFTMTTVEKSVLVNALPTVVATPPTGSYCTPGGTAVTIVASGASTYNWSPAVGLDVTTVATVNASPSSTTIYTVTGTDGNGCTNTATTNITVAAKPANVTATADPSTICSGGTSSLTGSGFVQNIASLANTYTFAGSTGTYNVISGTSVGASAIGDDVGVGNLPIGFTFNYNGTPETVFAVSSNGLIQLGNSTPTISGFSANALATTAKIIAPLWDDNNTTGGTVQYLTTGIVGSRILTVQWTGMHVGGSGSASNPTLDVQFKLYEATGVLQFVYGSTSAAFTSTTASIGISGASGNYRSVTPLSPPNTSTSSTVTENTTISSATNFPTGTTYTFTPPSLSFTYAWTAPTNLVSPSSQNTLTNALTATETFTLTASNAGCTTTAMTTVTVSTGPSITSDPIAVARCVGQTATFTVVATGPGLTYQWRKGGVDIPIGGNASAGTASLSLTNVMAGDADSYDVVVTATCGSPVTSAPAALMVNTLPTASASSNSPVCVGSTLNLSGTTNGTVFGWSGPNGFTSLAQNPTISNVTSAASGTYTFTATSAAGCTAAPVNTVVVINPSPTAIFITPGNPVLCTSSPAELLTATGGNVPGLVNFTSGTISQSIPDNSSTGTSHTLAITGIPVGATIDSVIVTINITHGWDEDVEVNLQAPNGSIINLVADRGSSGDNFVSTRISSDVSKPSFSTGTSPFTGTFKADLTAQVNLIGSPTITSQIFSDLYSIPNGNWILRAYDDASALIGPLTNWQIKIAYTAPVTTTWSPTTGLFTDAPATLAYTGGSTSTVYAKPASTTTYTVTASTASSLTFDGIIDESAWGTALATSAGGPAPGFGAGHEVNAAYVHANQNDINFAVAGNVQDMNRILVFIDSKSGGYNNGSFGRTGAPNGINNFNSGTTFDSGFEADYCLVIGTNVAHDNFFFDLYTLSASGSNQYLGDVSDLRIGADPLNASNTRGFELAIAKTLLGYTTGNLKIFVMYTGESGFLSNQFLTRAGSGDGNYGGGAVTFGAELPDPITVPNQNLNNYCTSTAMVTVGIEGTVVKNSADAGFNTLRSVYNCIADGGPTPITYDQPTTFTTLLTNPLTINKTLTIMGAGPTDKPEITVDFTTLGVSPGIMIGTNKTVTIMNVDVKDINNTNMVNNAVIEVQGTGTLKVTGSTVINKIP